MVECYLTHTAIDISVDIQYDQLNPLKPLYLRFCIFNLNDFLSTVKKFIRYNKFNKMSNILNLEF